MIFTASNFDISSSIICVEQVKIFHAGSTETIFRISANYSCWDFRQLSLQIVLEVFFIFNMIYVHWICFQTRGSLFFLSCSRHQKHPEEALWIQVTGRKQTKMDHPSVPYNKLLTNLASSSRTGEYWPSVVLYGPRCARSVLPRPRANIPLYVACSRLSVSEDPTPRPLAFQSSTDREPGSGYLYGPRARLVRGYY